jgi:hypothetical protein
MRGRRPAPDSGDTFGCLETEFEQTVSHGACVRHPEIWPVDLHSLRVAQEASDDARGQSNDEAQRPVHRGRGNAGLGTSWHTALRSMKKEIDLHRFKREDDAAVLNAVQNPSVQQRGDIGVYGLHISLHAARRFADGNRTSSTHRLEQFPPLSCQHFPEKLGCGESDARRFLSLPCLPDTDKICHRLARRADVKR